MKKIFLIAILAVVCALTCALGLTACDNFNTPPTGHTHDYQWVNNGDGTHKRHCAKDGCDKPDIDIGEHTYGSNDKCDKCNAEKPADGHTHNYQWVDNGDGTHKQHCANNGCNEPDINSGSHTWGANDKCDKCNADKTTAAHTHDYHWVNNFFDGTHQQNCRNEGCDAPVINVESHTYEGGVCSKCYDTEPPEGHVHDYQWQDDENNSHSLHCLTEGCYRPNPKDSVEDHIWGENGACEKCDAVNQQLHTHHWSTEYYCDGGSQHLQYCDSCIYGNYAEHNYVNDVCILCGHQKMSGSLTFTLNEDGESYSVKPRKEWGGEYDSTDTKIVIPCMYMGKPVTVISEEAFKDNTYITSVEISGCRLRHPSPITIERAAFSGCKKLKKVVLPQTVAEIGASAFYGCKALEEITVPFVGANENAVDNKANFGFIFGSPHYTSSSLYIPSSLKKIVVTGGTSIAPYAFNGCTGTTSITLPNGLTTIGMMAFNAGLIAINIPDTVTSIGESAFRGSDITSIVIPDGVQTIEASVFQGCSELAEITIGSGVKSIAADAFKDCEKLKKIYYKGELENWCCIDGLEEVTASLPALYINQQLLSGAVAIPSSVTDLRNGTFRGCSEITEIIIHAGVNSIGTNVFGGCSKLKSITVEENNAVYASQDGILYNKAKTECLAVPSSLSGEITIPQGITNISLSGTLVTSVNLPNGMTNIPNGAFLFCTLLENVKFPETVTSIDDHAFALCTSLKTIVIPDGVTRIGERAFEGCELLANITVPDSVTSIGTTAFRDTAWYESKSNGVVYIGKVAYGYKGSMPVNVTLAAGTKVIADSAFAQQIEMTFISIPDSVTNIGSYAFAGCVKLNTIRFGGTKAQWESIVAENDTWDDNMPSYAVHCSDEAIFVNQTI